MAIKIPFGADPNAKFYGGTTVLSRLGATATGSHTRTINSMFSYLHCVTSTKKCTLNLSIDSALPAGALLHIRKTDTGSGINLNTGFGDKLKGIGSGTVGKGTGHWVCGFYYNGTKFEPFSMSNINNLNAQRE